jgi:hypothetical protein
MSWATSTMATPREARLARGTGPAALADGLPDVWVDEADGVGPEVTAGAADAVGVTGSRVVGAAEVMGAELLNLVGRRYS